MVLRATALALILCGCLTKVPVQRLATRAPIAVAIVVDPDVPVPREFKARLDEVLDSRNLEARVVALPAQRLSAERFLALQSASDAPFALLVEARVLFFTQLNGRYRWTVSLKYTAGRPGVPSTQDAVDFPALLQFEHEREGEALDNVSDFAASRLAPLLDGLLVAAPVPDAGLALAPLAPADTLYFVMVDRFANGDRSNDVEVNPADPNAFHGGDLAGVRAHLDWLSELSVGTVWLSPVFAMRTQAFNGYPAFHGYWVEDLNRIEPRFGTEGQLKALRSELDARGMGLMLDVVLNHVGPATSLTRTHPEWFHGKGGIKDWSDPVQLVTHDVQGLPDLADEREDVYAYLRDAAVKWVRMVHPVGFRLDAVKHMPPSFWSRFNADMRAEAGDDFRLLGEMLDGDPSAVARTWREGSFSAMFDFPLRFATVDVFCKGQGPARLGAVLTDDRQYPDPSQLVTLLDNHDLPRIASECGGKGVEAAVQLMYAMRGVPSLTWGTEVGATGDKEPLNRASMKFDAGHAMRAAIVKAQALRRAHPSLSRGVPVITAASEKALVVKRIAPNEIATIEIVAASPSPQRGERAGVRGPPEGVEVRIRFETGEFVQAEAAARKQWLTGERKRKVELTGPADTFVVGSGPELGGWKPEKALALPAFTELPVGGVFELKLLSRAKAWEKGSNRVLFVADEPGPLKVELAWRGT